jgi:hypothetical protein
LFFGFHGLCIFTVRFTRLFGFDCLTILSCFHA